MDCVATPNDPSCIAVKNEMIRNILLDSLDPAKEKPDLKTCNTATSATPNPACLMASAADPLPAKIAQCRQCLDEVNINLALGNDTNTIIKVTPDRACSEWLACKTSETVYDAQTGSYKSVCSDLALCNDAKKSDTGEGIPFCTSYVTAVRTASTPFSRSTTY